ncbi:MAG: hypothetical protein H7A09_09205 [Oceanospirillaceae bacterium]|nr:hypothetical protein [Oceanospirillaceae bacterium]MCP5335840.1 hypothetical protein [Oceanospirillaceae bacterium]MCP5349638.1 hypothetical protein [Oceanospirillaceae bacterium]
MFLKKFIYVNWGNIPATEFDFGPINLLSGGNGSGKTTAADALQTIMTAAHDNLFNYNPGQDESTQKGRGKQVRTLASYVLGCDDGSYARPDGANGYLAAVFHPTAGESGQPFTAVLAVSAFIDKAGAQAVARQSDMLLMIVAGHELGLSDFLTDDEAGKQVVPLDKIFKRLGKRCGARAVEKYDTKKQYLRRFYGALRGREDAVSEREAMNAARAFSRFMAYKPVKSINGFVANEILEKKDLGEAIRTVSDLMKTIHAMESDANRLKEDIARLEVGRGHSQVYIDQWIDYQVAHYVAAKSRYMADQKAYRDAKQQQQDIRSQIHNAEDERQNAQSRRKQVREQLVGLEARRQGIPALKDKDRFEQDIAQFKTQLQQQAVALLDQDKQLQFSLSASASIAQLLNKTSIGAEVSALNERGLLQQAASLVKLREASQLDFAKLMNKDFIDMAPLEAHLDEALKRQESINQWRERWFNAELTQEGTSLRDQLARLVDRREQKLQNQQKKMQQIQQEIDRLNTAQVSYPYFVEAALDAIRRECPQAQPRVLCDYVEITDSEWQSAIEGYIGGARFSIIVEPEFEAEAIAIVRNMPGRDNRARVIQGSKAREDAERSKPAHNSIIQLMKFEHASAAAYLTASYGSVEQVPDAIALRKTRRGLTKQGMGSGAYSMYRCDLPDSELVFGQGARERAMQAKQDELRGLAEQANIAKQSAKEAQDLLIAVNQLRHLSYGDLLKNMVDIHRRWQGAEKNLEQMDLSDFSSLEAEYNQLAKQAEELDKQIQRLDGELGKAEQQLKDSEKRCIQLSEQQGKTSEQAESNEANIRAIGKLWPNFDVEKCLEEADAEAARTTAEIAQNQQQSILSELNSRAHGLDKSLAEHNQGCQTMDAIVYSPDYSDEHSAAFFREVCNVQREIERIHNRLRNNILVEKQDKLTSLKNSFDSAFVTNLCHAIYQSINEGKRTLEEMNRELVSHKFGTDKECYWFDWQWVPEFKDYWNFFEEVIKNPAIGEGQTLFEVKLSPKSVKVREQLMAMLLDEDEQKAMRELERISDYRNYREYEIFKQPEGKEPIALSQYGTGSGGQLETPAYIIRSAAITSAFRFNQGDTHLRMVLVDEAFSKMDETRSKEVINYLTESLGLQLLFIMPTSKSGPFMDLISNQFVFSKVPLAGGQSKRGELNTRVLVDRQACNQEKIQELWAQHRRVVRQQAELDFMEDLA